MMDSSSKAGVGRWRLLVGLSALLAAGCVSYLGVEPVSPGYGDTVDSLQPVFSWKPAEAAGVTYDLIIWAPAASKSREAMQLVEVYARNGITGTTHRVETPLAPDTEHTWGIRTRLGDEVSEWSTRKLVVFTGLTYDKRINPLCFETPAR